MSDDIEAACAKRAAERIATSFVNTTTMQGYIDAYSFVILDEFAPVIAAARAADTWQRMLHIAQDDRIKAEAENDALRETLVRFIGPEWGDPCAPPCPPEDDCPTCQARAALDGGKHD